MLVPALLLALAPSAHASGATFKLELLDALAALEKRPQVVWLGSSSSREASPGFVRALTARTMFNASVTAGRPYHASYFASYLAQLYPAPTRYPHLVYGLDIEQFTADRVRVVARRKSGAAPSPLATLTPWGFRRTNPYASWRLEDHLVERAALYADTIYDSFPRLSATQKAHIRTLLETANSRGERPTLVLMPMHAYTRKRLALVGRERRRAELRRYLASLADDGYRFRYADLSSTARFGGSDSGFYDGVHMRPATMGIMMRWLRRERLL